ncbi:MAG: hypothetical protein AB8G99_21425 [Planctomycetaceae bacterium]
MRSQTQICMLLLFAVALNLPVIANAQEEKSKASVKADAEKTKAAKQTPAKQKDAKEKEKAPPVPVAEDPYKVVVNLTVPRHRLMTAATRAALRDHVELMVRRTWGGMWNTDVRMNDWMLVGDAIERLQSDAVSERYEAKFDKVLFVALDPETLSLTAREWDFRSNSLTVPAFAETYDLAAVPNQIVHLLIEVFRPVLLFRRADKFDKSYIEVTLKAGEFPAPDPKAAQIKPGDVLTPVVRYFNKRNRDQVDRIQYQTLTYLVVQDIDRDVIGGTLVSGVPTVFGRNARRAEQFALRQRPRHKATRVKLVLRSNPEKPLLCHRVNLVSKLKYRDEELEKSVNLISDRYGEVVIPVGSYPTYWIYVYSGKLLLARIPYAPGLLAKETVLMPDDSMRLLVEGEVDLLKGRLIDLVARRAVHMSAAMQYSKDGKADETRAEVAALEALPGKKQFEDQITTFQQPAVQKALAARNRVSRGRINRVCGEMKRVIDNYFDPARMDAFRNQLNDVFESNGAQDDDDN